MYSTAPLSTRPITPDCLPFRTQQWFVDHCHHHHCGDYHDHRHYCHDPYDDDHHHDNQDEKVSVQLLLCFSIPIVLVLSWCLLKSRYQVGDHDGDDDNGDGDDGDDDGDFDGAAESNLNDNILITIPIQLSHIFGLVAGVMSVVVMVWLDVR